MGELEDRWQTKIEFAVVEALQRNIIDGKFLTAKTTLGSLNHREWADIAWTAICAFITMKAQEAVEYGTPGGLNIKVIPRNDPEPWEQGTVEACLPALGDIVEQIGAEKPIGAYSKAQIVKLIWTAIKLYRAAEAGRDAAERGALTPSANIGQEIFAG